MSCPTSLVDLLRAAADAVPQQIIVHVRADGTERVQTYGELRDEAARVSAALRRTGMKPGSPVIVLPERSEAFLPAFWGALLAGLVPVPLARETDKLLAITRFLEWPALIVDREFAARLPNLRPQSDELARHILAVDTLLQAEPDGYEHAALPSDLAYLQFSSGSTGQPKGVELTHANVLANIEQIITVTGAHADDTNVSWMPYAHDMGLVCTHLVPLAAGMKQVKIGPLHFVRRPMVWFEVAHRHRATILTAANFALMLVLKRVPPEQLAGIDLRTVRILANGSEPVSPRVCRAFLDLLAPCGLERTALLPVYGLAEACVGATFPPRGEEPVVHSLDRRTLTQNGRAVRADAGSEVVEIADLGFPLPGLALRIVDDDDQPVEEGVVGHVQIRGPNVMHRYHRALPDAQTFCDGWLRTGDQGFVIDGRLAVTGRTKDVIVVNGRKHHAHDVEEVVRQVPGVRPHAVAVVSTQQTGDEGVVVFVALETEHGKGDDWASEEGIRVLREVARGVQRVLGHPVTRVLPLRPREFPRTTSGKIQRYQLRSQYEAGAWSERVRAVEAGANRYEPTTHEQSGEPSDHYEAQVRAIWARVLGCRPADLGPHDDFRSLGGTSLQAMEVLVELEALVGRPLEPAVLLDRPTIADLADFLRVESMRAAGERGVIDKSATQASGHARGRIGTARHPRNRRHGMRKAARDPVAVIGMACRFPGADSPEQFWANLADGVDSVTEVPATRWSVHELYDPTPNATQARSISKWGAFLDDVGGFDAAFFDIDPAEAVVMDPQQRILLEVAFEALERAGYTGQRRATKRIGVFVGVGEVNYTEFLLRQVEEGLPMHPSAAVGNFRNLAAARIARALHLTGPVMAIDTACSSALVALHLARQSIVAGECDLAVVGAANLNLTATPYLLMSQAGALSPTGRCHAFDARADGFVPGEGAGVVVLASAANVRREGDRVIGVIRGTAVNNDGLSISPMAPNPLGQQAVLAQAYEDAGIPPQSVSYIEAHGTGTPIGDPIEVRSLHSIFPQSPDGTLRPVGSVKTNVGHLLNAAGMPALIKVLLQLEHRHIAPSLHYDQPSARFDLAAAGFEIPLALCPWTGAGPLRAGINGFGFGGTNAHVVLEEPPQSTPMYRGAATTVTAPDRQHHLLNLSARTATALRETARALRAYADTYPDASVADLCFSASTARDGAEYRAAAVIDGNLREVLTGIAEGHARPDAYVATIRRAQRPRVAFVFGGQGAQRAGQGLGLYRTEPAFAHALDRYVALVGSVLGRPLLEWCYNQGATDEDVVRTAVAQPFLVAFEIALAQLVIGWGLRPDAVVGHSIGEVAAAAVAGILPVDDALVLARERGRLMDALPHDGAMAAVFAPDETVRALMTQEASNVVIAAINGPREVTIAGPTGAVDDMLAVLKGEGIATKRLRVSHAFHSPLMGPMLQPFARTVAVITSSAPTVPFYSTVRDGTPDRLDTTYWLDHATQPVRFAPAIERLLEEGYDTFVEIGPSNTLSALVRRIGAAQGKQVVVQSLMGHDQDDEQALLGALARLWSIGAPIDRIAVEGQRERKRMVLPTYPFEHVHYWVPDAPRTNTTSASSKGSPVPLFYEPVWLDQPLAPSNDVERPRRWFLIPDQMGVAEHLSRLLRADGAACEIIGTPDLGARMTGDEPYGIVHLRGCEAAPEITDVDGLDQSLQQGVLDLLALAQTIARHPPAVQPAGLWVISSDAYVTGQPLERPVPEHAALAGLAQALPDEIPGLRCRHIDLQSAEGPASMAAIIARELQAGIDKQAPGEPITWRGGHRLARTLQRAEAPEASPSPANGIYLVTGGGSGLGAEFARVLARRDRATLVLLGRTPLADAPARRMLVAELEAMGATAEYLQVDIGDPIAIEAAIAHVVNVHGPITGVVHAAGVVDPGLLSGKTMDRFGAVLRPKVRGTWLLLDALRRHRQQLHFFVACSSLASVVPGLGGGLGDYVAANAYLDAIASVEHSAGRPFTTINWSVWAETGMGAQPALLERMRARGYAPLGSGDATNAFMRATASRAAQVVIADIAPMVEKARQRAATDAVGELRGSEDIPGIQPLSVERNDNVRQEPIHHLLQRLVAGALQIDAAQVPIDEPFMALGLDSLAAVDLVKALEREAGCSLPLTLFFEYTTIRELAVYLRTQAPALGEDQGVEAEPEGANIMADVMPDKADTPFELTPVQQAFLVNHELYPDVAAFSFLRQTIHGPLQPSLLLQALLMLEARHPMLRARIDRPRPSDAPTVRILPPDASMAVWPAWFEVRDDEQSSISATDDQIANRPFDLEHEAPFRVVLIRHGERSDVVMCAHHIVADGWSLNVLAEELWQVYTRLAHGLSPNLPPLSSTFKDYERGADIGSSEEDLGWWQGTLAKHVTSSPLRLPYDGDPQAVPSGPRSAIQVQLDARLVGQLRELAVGAGLSLFHVLLAGYVRCLAKWSGESGLIVNVAQAGRGARLPQIEHLVGCFADTLPIPMRSDQSTLQTAQHVRRIWLAAQQHSAVSSYDLARLLPPSGMAGPRTASPASFSFARFPHQYPADCPVHIEATAARTGSAATRLALLAWEMNEALHFSWNFPSTLFQHATVERLAGDYVRELEQAIGVAERRDEPSLTLGRILAQCARTPDAVAVRCGGEVLTYHELDHQSSLVAARLRRHGLTPDRPVGLLVLPGPGSVVGILGIMKAGVPWLPLEPDDPRARLRRQIELLDVDLIVCEDATSDTVEVLAAETGSIAVCLDALPDDLPASNDRTAVAPESIAYVIFTSGSTGSPKAVPITHAALANYLGWMTDTFHYAVGDRILQTASLCFDASVSQILAPLTVGAAVVPVPKDRLRDPAALLEWVLEEQPTVWRSVPSLWERVLRIIERGQREGQGLPHLHLRWISVGGEALPASLVRRWTNLFGDAQRISNHYGPTEATINATCFLVPRRPNEDDEQIPIGQPIRGAKVRVCGEDGEPVIPGMIGELYIGGVGLTPGYLGKPDHAGTRFWVDDAGQRWYRSGDLVRERSDGELVFVGRIDDQIKIRGYRIELAEIEAALCRYSAVGQAVVMAHATDSGTTELVAYIEPRAAVPSPVELRRFLRQELPAYMIPHQFHVVDAFPTGSTGKVDRRRLSEEATALAAATGSDGGQVRDERGPQSSPSRSSWTLTERLLATVWEEVLQTAPLNREDDFFELGGDSLRALAIFAHLQGRIAKLPRASVIYRHHTLAALASAIDAEQQTADARPQPPLTDEGAMFRTTPAQAGFLLAAALAPDVPTNWCASIRIRGPFDLHAFTRAIHILMERHPMLRTIFPPGVTPPQQKEIQPDNPFQIHYEDFTSLRDDPVAQQARLDACWEAERAHRFDTGHWPLLRIRVCGLAREEHVWFVTAHHVIGDGWSAAIFGQELFKVYDRLIAGAEPALPPLRSTFREYVALLEHEHTTHGAKRAHYWRRVFAAPYAPPVAWREPAVASFTGERFSTETAELSATTVHGLKEVAGSERVTLYAVLLTAFFRQLRRLTATDDLVVGTAVSGRDHPLPDIMRIFGCFATALPIRAPVEDKEYRAQLRQVAALFVAAQEHQLAPQQIARLVAGQAPLASIVGAQFFFTYMDFGSLPLTSDTLAVEWDMSRTAMDPPGHTDVLLAVRVVDGCLRMTVQGATSALSPERLAAFTNDLVADLGVLASLSTEVADRTAAVPHVRFVHDNGQVLDGRPIDAALVGYLPPWQDFARHLQVADTPALRDQLRSALFEDNKPRLLEVSETRLGRSGFVCIPWFADELTPERSRHFHPDVALGVHLSAELGARCVSLAGMLPSLTGYGFDISRQLGPTDVPSLTTGHALTVVSVVMAIEAALGRVQRCLPELDIAFVGLGSIGRAVLELLLWRGQHPRSITLCDVRGSVARLGQVEQQLRHSTGYAGSVRCVEADNGGQVPPSVYDANLIVGATSRPRALDVAHLRPGTVVVDDSFPHCFDTKAAIARMRGAADVLLVGGGLLDCGPTERTIYVPAAGASVQDRIAQRLPYHAIASCQLESLLHAANPTLPIVRGLVDLGVAQGYWKAAVAANIQAGTLHLENFTPDEPLLERLRHLDRK